MRKSKLYEEESFREFIKGINGRDPSVLNSEIGLCLTELASEREDVHFSRIAFRDFKKYEDTDDSKLSETELMVKRISGNPELEELISKDRDLFNRFNDVNCVSDFQRGEFFFYPFLYDLVEEIFNYRPGQNRIYRDVQKNIFGDLSIFKNINYDKGKIKNIFDVLFPTEDVKREKERLLVQDEEAYVKNEKKEFDGLLSLFENIGFKGCKPEDGKLEEGTLGRLLFEYGLKSPFALSSAQKPDDDDFKGRFNRLLKESINLDSIKYKSETDDRIELRGAIYDYFFKKKNSIENILQLCYRINGNKNDIISSIQKRGVDMLRYMIQANSSRVINDEKYKPLREAFKKIEEGKKIIKSDGKFDEEKRFIPIGYWKALEPYISEVAGELMKHPILLGDGDLIRLKEGELRYNEISKKVEANVVIASKKGMYHQEWRLETRAKYDPKDWARIANELLSVPGTDSNRGYFIGLLTEEFKEEIKRTRSSKQPLQCIAIGVVLVAIPAGIGFAYMVGVDIPAENTTKVGCAISGLFGTGLSFYGIKTRYKGLRVNVEKDFSFNIAPPEKQVFGVKEIIPINYNSGKNQ